MHSFLSKLFLPLHEQTWNSTSGVHVWPHGRGHGHVTRRELSSR